MSDPIQKIVLPDENTECGIEARLLMAECETPAYSDYTLKKAIKCMQWMHVVLENRLRDPGHYNARGAKNLFDIMPNFIQ